MRTVTSPVRDNRCMWLVERLSGEKTPCCARDYWQVCLDVRSSRNEDFFRVVTPFRICTGHKKSVTLSAMLDGSWDRIRSVFRHQGKKEPRRRLTELTFERIDELQRKRPPSSVQGHACQAS